MSDIKEEIMKSDLFRQRWYVILNSAYLLLALTLWYVYLSPPSLKACYEPLIVLKACEADVSANLQNNFSKNFAFGVVVSSCVNLVIRGFHFLSNDKQPLMPDMSRTGEARNTSFRDRLLARLYSLTPYIGLLFVIPIVYLAVQAAKENLFQLDIDKCVKDYVFDESCLVTLIKTQYKSNQKYSTGGGFMSAFVISSALMLLYNLIELLAPRIKNKCHSLFFKPSNDLQVGVSNNAPHNNDEEAGLIIPLLQNRK